jgi:hypothetical protein
MNILALENKFKALDEKEKKIRQYFNPKTSKGKKHHYIADIRADFHYDTLLYGLGMFWQQESEEDSLHAEEDKESEEKKAEPPKLTLKTENKQGKTSPVLAKRKNLALLELQNPLVKDHYEGTFSYTKVLNHDYLYKKQHTNFGKSGWKTTASGQRNVKNKAAMNEIIYSSKVKDYSAEINAKLNEYRETSAHKLRRNSRQALTAEQFRSYLEEFKQQVFVEKEPKRFILDMDKLRQEPISQKIEEERVDLFKIVFLNTFYIEIKSQNCLSNLTIIDINSPTLASKEFKDIPTDNNQASCFDLSSLFPYQISSHTFRILVQGEIETLDYYLSMQPHSSMSEQAVRSDIIAYKLSVYASVTSNPKHSVVPLTLERLKQKSAPKPKRVTLPVIASKPRTSVSPKKRHYQNPITSVLFTYKNAVESFHPLAYPANLSIFEAHDFIEENYSLPPKPRVDKQSPNVRLTVSGFGINNTFIKP